MAAHSAGGALAGSNQLERLCVDAANQDQALVSAAWFQHARGDRGQATAVEAGREGGQRVETLFRWQREAATNAAEDTRAPTASERGHD